MSTEARHIIQNVSIDEQIINLLQAKDKRALHLIYEHYAAVLINVILRVVCDKPMAEDVFQEALLKTWKNGHTYDAEKGGLFTWLTRVCRNAAIDKTRSKDFKQTERSKTAIDLVSITGLGNREEEVEHLYMHQLVDQLPVIQRKLIDLAYFQGYTQKEIAEKLDMPLGTVKTRIRLALKHLRSII